MIYDFCEFLYLNSFYIISNFENIKRIYFKKFSKRFELEICVSDNNYFLYCRR